MNFTTKQSVICNWVILAYLFSIVVIALNDKITFGHGLGDMFYLLEISLGIVSHAFLILIFSKKKFSKHRNKLNWITGFIFFLFAVFITYEFTFGRGGEYPWKGNIFIN